MDRETDLIRRTIVPNPDLDPTRAQPEPWFVGSGKGLMIAIVSICAILVVIRGISTVWMAEEAYEWWRHRPAAAAPAPTPVAGKPSAAESTDAAYWITADDYPPASIRADEQGTVAIRWQVNSAGRATKCDILKSSGHRRLDEAACRAVIRNARYPRIDEGQPPRQHVRRVVWRLPDA